MNTLDRIDTRHPLLRDGSNGHRLSAAWRSVLARLRASAATRRRGACHDDLGELDAHALADIGAPEPLLARAWARREAQRQEREGLRMGLGCGVWRDW